MAEQRQARAWDHTSTLACYIIRMQGDPKKTKHITPESLHPYVKKKPGAAKRRGGDGIALFAGNIKILKSVFVDGFLRNENENQAGVHSG